jgi:hypothetical protein
MVCLWSGEVVTVLSCAEHQENIQESVKYSSMQLSRWGGGGECSALMFWPHYPLSKPPGSAPDTVGTLRRRENSLALDSNRKLIYQIPYS